LSSRSKAKCHASKAPIKTPQKVEKNDVYVNVVSVLQNSDLQCNAESLGVSQQQKKRNEIKSHQKIKKRRVKTISLRSSRAGTLGGRLGALQKKYF
jgi:hypothetical protein